MQRKDPFQDNTNGIAHYDQNELDVAISDFTQAIALDDNSNHLTIYYANRGTVYYCQNKYEEAISDFCQAIAYDPNYALAYNNLGIVYSTQRKLDLAIANYTIAINLKPNFGSAYHNRGFCFTLKKEFNLAMMDFEKALKLDSKSEPLRAKLKILLNAIKMNDLNVKIIGKDTVFEAIQALPLEDQKIYLQRCLTLNDPLHEFFNTQRGSEPCAYNTGTFLKIINYMKDKKIPFTIDNSPPEFTQKIYYGNVKDRLSGAQHAKAVKEFQKHRFVFSAEQEKHIDQHWKLGLFKPKNETGKEQPFSLTLSMQKNARK
jgi:tetratricopeptide (TPR) repeat protein